MADVAMTKRGFGEMAITGCIAGPIFNILIGLGLSTSITIFNEVGFGAFKGTNTISFSLFQTDANGEKQVNKQAVLPLTLIIG
jgi:Ca2+/Na+ antiporter